MENEKILKIGLSIVGGLLLILLIPFILFYSFIFLIMIIYGFSGQGPFGQLSFIICPSIIILPLLVLLIIYIKRKKLNIANINLDKIDKKLDEMEIWVKEKFNIK
jgi:hypothetical protein